MATAVNSFISAASWAGSDGADRTQCFFLLSQLKPSSLSTGRSPKVPEPEAMMVFEAPLVSVRGGRVSLWCVRRGGWGRWDLGVGGLSGEGESGGTSERVGSSMIEKPVTGEGSLCGGVSSFRKILAQSSSSDWKESD